MRRLVLLIAAAALSAEAPAPSDLQSFDRALATGHGEEAAAIVDRLIVQRTPADGKPHPDPLLNALIGRLYLWWQFYPAAATYLDHAPIAQLPPALRAETGLAHGRALEARGDGAAALEAYREALTASADDSDRRRASLGIARVLLPSDPAAARREVAAIAAGPLTAQRWQARYILALASSLEGDAKGAATAADDAWADAANAPLADLAPLHVATLRAGLAAAAHDVPAERAMLTAAGGLNVSANPGLSAQLPVCGTGGVRPSDFVIFGFLSGPYVNRQLVPISASRPEIVKTFYNALALTVPVHAAEARPPFGTVFTVACRTLVSSDLTTRPPTENPMLEWFVGRGLYPASASFDSDDKSVDAITARIDALAARYGMDSPLVIAPRWQLAQSLEQRARKGDPVNPVQVTGLYAQVATGLRHSGAPAWLAGMVDTNAALVDLATAHLGSAATFTRRQSLIEGQLRQLPPELGRERVDAMTSDLRNDWPVAAAQFVLAVSPSITPGLSGTERQSWLLTLAQAQYSAGEDAAARATLASAQLADTLCARMDQEPRLLDQKFAPSGYPQELNRGDQQGAVLFDFDLAPTGRVAAYRIVYSLPSGLFDAASEEGVPKVHYSVPFKNGQPSSCRGVYQPIVWRLPPDAKPVPWRFTPDPAPPAS